jgi:hypothetical protein
MFSEEEYRAKAAEYAARGKQSDVASEVREFHDLAKSFSVLADNEEWLAVNYQNTLHAAGEQNRSSVAPPGAPDDGVLALQEEHILRCLGASVLMLWNVIPSKLQRELFDSAGSMDVLNTAELRGRIARLLQKHSDAEQAPR